MEEENKNKLDYPTPKDGKRLHQPPVQQLRFYKGIVSSLHLWAQHRPKTKKYCTPQNQPSLLLSQDSIAQRANGARDIYSGFLRHRHLSVRLLDVRIRAKSKRVNQHQELTSPGQEQSMSGQKESGTCIWIHKHMPHMPLLLFAVTKKNFYI